LESKEMRYNSPNSPIDNFQRLLFRGGIPITTALLLVNAATFLLAFMLPSLMQFFAENLAFQTPYVFLKPWTLLTYPLVYLDTTAQGFFNFLFGGFTLWSLGGSLERSWGSQKYGLFFFAMALISALCLLLGTILLHQPDALFGFFLPLACGIIAFCMIQPEATIQVFLFPVKAKYFAVVVALFTWVYVGQGGRALLGIFALGGLLAAMLYVRYGRSWAAGSFGASSRTRGPDLRMDSRPVRPAFRTTLDGSPAQRRFFDFAGRWKDWQERRRLEKLWKNSGFSTSETEWRDDEKRRK
jgi:membrane associated rhomboid family serine protease